jgi:glyceraldehyde-3-phosphate dehydrogenase (ferredoxin)
MVPNQYWVPGMGAPMPIMGKYYVYYGTDFMAPEDLGRNCVERMVLELISDNCGECRFHRGWGEALLPVIMTEHFGLRVDFKDHHFYLAREIYRHQGDRARPWATKRMAEMLKGYLDNFAPDQVSTEGEVMLLAFDEDKPVESAQTFWRMIRYGIDRTFKLGAGAVARAMTPKQRSERFGGDVVL